MYTESMSLVKTKTMHPLAPYTSFGVGGSAEEFYETNSIEDLLKLLTQNYFSKIWILGYGSNTLISDKGLPGLTIALRGGEIVFDEETVTVDAGVWWDDVVKASVDRELWGIELLSEIPGSVGAALVINIAAYGQTVGKVVKWVELWDPKKQTRIRLDSHELLWSYKQSVFQSDVFHGTTILRACFTLSPTKTVEIGYQKAIDIAEELQLNSDELIDRRSIIIEARRRAGSLWHPDDKSNSQPRTAGSFFKNPLIDANQVEAIIRHDESGITATQIKKMNRLHGGDTSRVSAAHVMLAAGFSRGQMFGNVKLNDSNLLKIEALDGASAAEIYAVMKQIQQTCQDKLHIKLEPEVQLLGDFDD